jgi:hypothetical protein
MLEDALGPRHRAHKRASLKEETFIRSPMKIVSS